MSPPKRHRFSKVVDYLLKKTNLARNLRKAVLELAQNSTLLSRRVSEEYLSNRLDIIRGGLKLQQVTRRDVIKELERMEHVPLKSWDILIPLDSSIDSPELAFECASMKLGQCVLATCLPKGFPWPEDFAHALNLPGTRLLYAKVKAESLSDDLHKAVATAYTVCDVSMLALRLGLRHSWNRTSSPPRLRLSKNLAYLKAHKSAKWTNRWERDAGQRSLLPRSAKDYSAGAVSSALFRAMNVSTGMSGALDGNSRILGAYLEANAAEHEDHTDRSFLRYVTALEHLVQVDEFAERNSTLALQTRIVFLAAPQKDQLKIPVELATKPKSCKVLQLIEALGDLYVKRSDLVHSWAPGIAEEYFSRKMLVFLHDLLCAALQNADRIRTDYSLIHDKEVQVYYDMCIWALIGLCSSLSPPLLATATFQGQIEWAAEGDLPQRSLNAALETLRLAGLCRASEDDIFVPTSSGKQVAKKIILLYGSRLGKYTAPRRPKRSRHDKH